MGESPHGPCAPVQGSPVLTNHFDLQQEEDVSVQENHQAGVSAAHQPQSVVPKPLAVVGGERPWVTNPQSVSTEPNSRLQVNT